MNVEATLDQAALDAEFAQARERLDALDRDLRAVDAELESLSADHERFLLLQTACTALGKLGELGAAELFWGEQFAGEKSAQHLRRVGARVDAFQRQWGEVEARREAVIEQIRQVEEQVEIIEESLFQAQQAEERRKLEWIIEREIDALPARRAVMPWARGGEDDRRLRKALGTSLLAALVLGLILPLVDLPLPPLGEPIEVPERLARLVEQRRPPPPPPVREEPQPEVPEPVVEETPQPTEEEPVVAQAPTPQPTPQPEPNTRQRAESAGILAFREKFSGLADSRPSAQLGADARISGAGEEAAGPAQRSMVTTQAPGSSGGINLASLSRGGGGGGGGSLAGVQVTRATSSIGGGGAGRPTAGGGGGGATASRTDEEIQIVFDRHKASLYRLYNRELRRDPTLRGQMVLRIRIEPDGRVSLCELQSTDMNAPELSAQVLERVGTFNFGAKDVPPVNILYPIDFLPAT
ncbi:AgmX/PglI C-terminal domain-containing protein [Thioalkalivibrio sp. XN279]|uniref:AgmX/PglI C-terminal domain-containing protein n=1 Tax=Thioalkalivibrio sp. XN279 TaxID=2714953 RepID=UPI00140B3B20|nr:AgmX/PglI C-terminal domain-containing protein [Thioalkalivibrio sp. XN279]